MLSCPLFPPMARYDVSAIGVGEFLVCMKVTLLLVWLKVFLFLPGWPQLGHAQRLGPPEVVIPWRVTPTGRGMKLQGWFSYKLHFGGQRHVVHIKVKKNFLSKNFPVFTYADKGVLLQDQPFVQDDCYYRGYVEGDPESLVSLSNCFGGFQGMLQTNDVVYEIEPKRFSTAFEHLIYKLDNEEMNFSYFQCGLTDEKIAGQLKIQESINSTLMQSDYTGWWTHHYFVEVAVVVDHSRYLHHSSNASLVQKEVFLVLNGVSDLMKALGLEVFFKGMEIWTKQSLISVVDITHTLMNFCRWKQKGFHNRVPHDVAHFFVKKNFGNEFGLAYDAQACAVRYSCSVETFHDEGTFFYSYVVAHDVGHNLGMHHDTETCQCGAPKCIMFEAVEATTKFSNCSYADYWNVGRRRSCLYNTPNPHTLVTEIRCGNSVVDEGEECDCGSLKTCNTDPCCQLNCTVTAGINCAFGLCCDNCMFRKPGTLCRKEKNECDLPEWCNGTSNQCPDDVYVQDGASCTGGGYCYGKRCNERDEHCRQIFGKEAKDADMSCYTAVNTRGDRFGNCGITETSYIRCSMADSLCGRIQCENVKEIPLMSDHTTLHSTNFDNNTCWGTDYHLGIRIADIGAVKDGTKCGPENICIRRRCVSYSTVPRNCSPQLCSLRGVCNNRQHCHCNYGWGPPVCQEKGRGGSVDSGPAPERQTEERMDRKNLLTYFLIPFLFLLLCLLLWLWLFTRPKKKDEKEQAVPPKSEKTTQKLPKK
ncbi:disintegrin and metalloproteinase domain-containing protein 20-like [Bos javanicus]|uniref:disintegrin and metalloproteinase domain-containing protein 20-like n=1 Tax=Bos javanicus TaxID=9906 RepID=UPI002AA7F58B|nr:disintegrin and metalloproteinase domain-containing protein 20-like [Bos javanicus]XP_061280951.1 disintegrin and metalloproteinase domain-containing protein 20-like [Bos javanicus]XP_061280952.1 disintegrin and metalloproteinase domain-containing protein 20-like [Bos javanicus]XP_061280953.1 disintegrin and metalloproteinase domain-containing protein 20-like [Bos javanicus]XP_061280955.1 disintegrin and metalloproteinase domain-containing protein 20-like [Bos javanicus]XP_061280956.1 disin